nr:acetyl-CoA carboxylase biotin carboxylase [Amycolatopsis sp.]
MLIANRGEIAVRIARTCRELGIRTVVAHSTEDGELARSGYFDEAVRIGPGPARRSYLNIAAVVEAALRVGADAIHPGYGFLSEDPDFAEVCRDNGIVLIGPPPEVMAQLGDKTAARAAMSAAGLPLLPGSLDPVATVAQAEALAGEVGYPLIIKAAGGGGGRGMRVVHHPRDLAAAFTETAATALAVFGDGRVYIERYLVSARHVEVQVLCDRHGHAIQLGERDCSVQRRHQKLIEETPAPGLPAGLAERMGEAAVRGALAVGYEGAGTFEFLLDPAGRFYFIEANCRIQVEHPVTEMVTGLDLVAEQIRVAAGLPLPIRQEDIVRRGVSIECRINAEDPGRDFVPTPGTLTEFVPAGGPFVRVDTHCHPGYRVPSNYDSLLAKLIVWAPDRAAAVARMRRSLDEFRLAGPGVSTTAGFLAELLDHPAFRRGEHDTALVERVLDARRAGNIA